MSQPRVVITGIGIWSCLGTDCPSVTQALREGRSGIGIDPLRTEYGYQSSLTGLVERPKLKGVLDRRLRTGLAEEGEFAYMASREALSMAGIDEAMLDSREIGCIFGNDSSAKPVIEAANIMNDKHDSALLGSGFIFQSMNSTVSAACASGSHSIGLAYMLIRQGLQDLVLCGGAQEVNHYSMATFDALGAFSKRMDEPQRASRPFDAERDGLIPSGGAAALVVESYESAVQRGANILCEVVGYGFSGNGGGISQPSDEGSFVAMSRALTDAGLSVADIDYINAHATSTPQGDHYEALALARLFGGENCPYISSTKGMTGHECWMAGASEVVYSILMMQNSFVAPNLNLENPDEAAANLNLVRQTIDTPVRTVLSNSFGFGGTNSALILRAID